MPVQYLPLFIPLAVVELALMIAALAHLIRHRKTRNLNPAVWAVLIVLIEIIGPVLYFAVGREEDG